MMSLNYADCQSGQPVFAEWQQPPTQTPDYMECQQFYQFHAARQPYFQQPLHQHNTSYHPPLPLPPLNRHPPDPPDWGPPTHRQQFGFQHYDQASDSSSDSSIQQPRTFHERYQPWQPSDNPLPQHQQRSPNAYTRSGQQDRAWSYQLDRPSLPPLPIIKPTSCWGPPGQRDHFGSPQFNWHQSPPLPPRSPTCWDPPAQQASKGYPTYDQSPPPDWPATPPQCSPSSWCPSRRELPTTVDVDVGYTTHPFGEETYESDDPFRRTETATVHAAAALPQSVIPPPPAAAVSLFCSPRVQIGERDALLEYGKDDGFLNASSLSPLSRHEALECIQIESGLCQQFNDDAVRAIAICCPQRRQLGISGVQEVDVGAMNALATHCPNLRGFSKEDTLDYRELLSVQDSFRYTEGVVTEGVKVADVSKDAPAVADEEKIASRNQVEEKECEGKEMTLDQHAKILEGKRTAFQAPKTDIRKDNSGGAAAHIYFFEFISKVDMGMTYPIYRENYEKYCHSNCRQGFQMRIALPKFLLNSVDGVTGRILKEQAWFWKHHPAPIETVLLIRAQLTREMESLAPDRQSGYKQGLSDRSAQERTEFLSKVAEFSHFQAVDVAKVMEPIPSKTVAVSCAIEEKEEEDPKSNSRWFSHNISFTDEATTVSETSISSLEYTVLLNLLGRNVTISLTNVVILGVVKRLMSCLSEKLEHTEYGFGDVILFGRAKRIKIDEHKEFYDVLLDSRILEPRCLIAHWFPP